MISGVVRRSHGVYLMDEENPGKRLQRGRLLKAVQPVIVSNSVPYL